MAHTTASERVSLAPWGAVGELDPRSQRARAERMAVTPLGGGLYEVTSESDNIYSVDLLFRFLQQNGGRLSQRARDTATGVLEGTVPNPVPDAVHYAPQGFVRARMSSRLARAEQWDPARVIDGYAHVTTRASRGGAARVTVEPAQPAAGGAPLLLGVGALGALGLLALSGSKAKVMR